MSTSFTTRKRRIEQVLWSKLDQHLLPFIYQGVVLAISGGPDSRALLEAIATWPNRLKGRFVVAVVDHGQRSEAAQEASHILLRSKRLGFDAHSEALPIFDFAQEHDLRKARYRNLSRVAKLYDCHAICTAHHHDDDAEGFFMALMGVGGGEMGAAMREAEPLENLMLIRPFLSLTKKDLLLTLSLKGQSDFVRDKLDEARVGERAYVRHEIFPDLFLKAPGVEKRLANFGRAQRAHRGIIDNLAKSLVIWHDNQAKIRVDAQVEPELMVAALWQILKKLSNGKDLRACQPMIDKLAKDLTKTDNREKRITPGLDQTSNEFNLKSLNRKEYQFPGVLVIKSPGSIIAKRV